MSAGDREALLADWAEHYDASVGSQDGFPFAGYECVLQRIVQLADVQPGATVLDLGTGTGNLARRFVALGCAVWATDFSAAMLAQARSKVPQATFVRADLREEWPRALQQRFDRIVSGYVLHEFDLDTKVGLLDRWATDHLTPGGRIVVGDVAFPTREARAQGHQRWARAWDGEEHYWAAEEAISACRAAGLEARYVQVSCSGGVFVFGSPTIIGVGNQSGGAK